MKGLLLLFTLLFINLSIAQSIERIEVTGTVVVPKGYSSGGIHVYNKSSGKGNVSDSGGNFELKVTEGDSVYFSALQFKELLVIVDAEVVKRRRLVVEILEGINELPEVVIRPHDLTGNLGADVAGIKVEELDLPTMTAFSINDYDWEWRADGQSAVTNAAMPSGTGMQYGAKPFAILSGLVGLVLPPKKVKKAVPSQRNTMGLIKLEREIRSRYDEIFFKDALNIPLESISNFIEYVDSQGFSADLLEEGQELELIELLIQRSKEFAKG